MTIETVQEADAAIGESPTWVAEERALNRIDVKAPALHRLSVDNGSTSTWKLRSDVGAFALTGNGAAVDALREGLHRLDLDSGALHLIAPRRSIRRCSASTKARAKPTAASGSA